MLLLKTLIFLFLTVFVSSKTYTHCFVKDHCCSIKIPLENVTSFNKINIFVPDKNATYLIEKFSSAQKNDTEQINTFVTYTITHNTSFATYECTIKLASFFADHVNTFLLSKLPKIVFISEGIGSQIVGISNNDVEGKYEKIIALNPSRPYFSMKSNKTRLNKHSAKNVYAVHSCINTNFLHYSSNYNRVVGTINIYFEHTSEDLQNCTNKGVNFIYESIQQQQRFFFQETTVRNIFGGKICHTKNKTAIIHNQHLFQLNEGIYIVLDNKINSTIVHENKTKYFHMLICIIICGLVLNLIYFLCMKYYIRQSIADKCTSYIFVHDLG